MNELEKSAEEYVKNRNYSDVNEGYSPGEVELECEAAFKAGAEWQAKQSPWVSVEERLPEHNNGQSLCEVLVKWCDGRCLITANICVEDMAKRGEITHWMSIPEEYG